MNKVPTVSDTKRDFYQRHTRPVNSIYRRVVEELMVEMHLLSVNVDFRYDPIYGLGVVSSFNRFMDGYQPEQDKESIFEAICRSVGYEPENYRRDSNLAKAISQSLSGKELVSWFSTPTPLEGVGELDKTVKEITSNSKFKYSRLFAIGIYTLLESAHPELVKDEKQLSEALKQISNSLNIPEDKLQKDLELYRSNLEKMVQAQIMMQDAVKAERKKREKLAQERNQAATSTQSSQAPNQESDTPKDEAPSS